MHPMIAAFSAQAFYHNRLRTGISEHDRLPPCGFQWPRPDSGVAFIHVQGVEYRDGESHTNDEESEQVIYVLEQVLRAGELSVLDVGVVSPYAAQVRVLRQKLQGYHSVLAWNLWGTEV